MCMKHAEDGRKKINLLYKYVGVHGGAIYEIRSLTKITGFWYVTPCSMAGTTRFDISEGPFLNTYRHENLNLIKFHYLTP
jgi:hypothetical protein